MNSDSLSVDELRWLNQFHPHWGTVIDHPNVAMTDGLTEQQARTLRKKINGVVDNLRSEHVEDDYQRCFVAKGREGDKGSYYVYIKLDEQRLSPKKIDIQALIEESKKARQITPFKMQSLPSRIHPILTLNYAVRSKEHVEKSLEKQRQIAKSIFKGKKKKIWFISKKNNRTKDLDDISILLTKEGENFGVASTKGKRTVNEDQSLKENIEINGGKAKLYGIFDGYSPLSDETHSGRLCSLFASEKFSGILKKEVEEQFSRSSDEKSAFFNGLKLAFVKTSDQMRGVLKNAQKKESGTAATVVLVTQDKSLWAASAGDSGAIFITSNHVIPLSYDEKPVESNSEQEEIPKENRSIYNREGIVFYCRGLAACGPELPIKRALGFKLNSGINPRGKVIHIPVADPERQTKGNSFLIIASSGLWNVMNPQEAKECIFNSEKQKTCEEIARELVKKAVEKGSNDNTTAVVVRFPPRSLSGN